MKQFLVLALLATTVLAVFYLMRGGKPATPSGPGAQIAGAPAAPKTGPGTQRPAVPAGARGGARGGEAATRPAGDDGERTVSTKHGPARSVLPPELEALMEERENFNWYDTVTEETLVKVEDAWGIDTSRVSWEAPVLITVNGKPITQDTLRRFAVLDSGALLVRGELFALAGQRLAASTGQPFGLTDEQFELYMHFWGQRRGLSGDQAVAQTALTTRLPAEAARKARRDMVEALLAYYPVAATSAKDLPAELLDVFQGDRLRADALKLIQLVHESRNKTGGDEQHMRDLVELLEPMATMWQLGVGEQETFQRTWTCLDNDLPSDAVAAYFAGEVDPERPTPPWNLAGEVRFVRTDPLWELLRPMMTPERLRFHLRQAVWSTVLHDALAAKGALPSPDQAWTEYAQEHLQGQTAILGATFLALGVQAFPSLSHYRDYQRVHAGFLRTRPAGWDSEETLREFFPRHRFFVQNWLPDMDVAYFPPRDLSKPIVGDGDWGYALEQAQEFRQRVTSGGEDFGEAVMAHSDKLEAAFRERLGEPEAQRFRAVFQGGHLVGPVRELQATLGDSEYTHLMKCASLVRNAVARLEVGDVSEPWRAESGYVVLRMNRARLSGLEDEFEDMVDATRQLYWELHFLRWANDALTAATIVVP